MSQAFNREHSLPDLVTSAPFIAVCLPVPAQNSSLTFHALFFFNRTAPALQ